MDDEKKEVEKVGATTVASAGVGAFIGGVPGAIVGAAFGLCASLSKIFKDNN